MRNSPGYYCFPNWSPMQLMTTFTRANFGEQTGTDVFPLVDRASVHHMDEILIAFFNIYDSYSW